MSGFFDPTGLLIAAGRRNNWTADIKFGANNSVATAWEALVSQGGSTLINNTAAVIEFTGNASDTALGSGARTIEFSAVDENFDQQTETVTMTGATAASSVGTYLYVYRMKVLTAGSALGNIGDIPATIGGSTMCQISAGSGQSMQLQRPVPRDAMLYMTGIATAVAKGDDVDLRIREYDQDNGVWRVKLDMHAYQTTEKLRFLPPYTFKEKHLISIEAKTTNAAGSKVEGWFDYIISQGDT